MTKKLYRSKNNRMVAGICAGIGEYLDVDPTVVRLIWAILTLITGIFPFVIIYLLAWIIIPEKYGKKIKKK